MRYTTDDQGILNNYAVEPTVYFAEYPSYYEQQQYLWQSAVAVLVVTLTVLTAFAVS